MQIGGPTIRRPYAADLCQLKDTRLRKLLVEMKMNNMEEDRFGVPTERILEVISAHGGLIRCGCYIPTRREVAEGDPIWLRNIILDWWWESPSELIPCDGQIADVIGILRARPDARTALIQEIIAEAPPPDGD